MPSCRPWRLWLSRPLVLAALATGLAAGLATALAQQPGLAFLGSGERAMGLVGILALLALFGAELGPVAQKREVPDAQG